MLFGVAPYCSFNDKELFKAVNSTEIDMPYKINKLSYECYDLLKAMLKRKPNDR